MIKTVQIGPYHLYADDARGTGASILGNGWNYEVHVRQELEKWIPESCGFLDIGANVGTHSIIAKAIRPDVPVYCVEMSRSNLDLLLRTITLNKISDIVVIPVAVASAPTIIRHNNDPDNTNCADDMVAGDFPHLAAALPMDFYQIPPVDLIKMDIEGFEMAALRGMISTLRTVKRLIFELNLEPLRRNGVDVTKMLQWLMDKGFRLTMLDYKPGLRRDFDRAEQVLEYMKEKDLCITDMIAQRSL